MRRISVAVTRAQVATKQKTVTRRLGWLDLKPGTLLQPVDKVRGLKPGQRSVPIGGPVRVVKVSRERLDAITAEDVVREGFPDWTPKDFVQFYVDTFGASPATLVTRIEWEYAADAR